WGLPRFIYGVQRIGRWWDANHAAAWGKFRVGDISLPNGGPNPGHASHQLGEDGDFGPIRNDGQSAAVTRFDSTYSRSRTNELIQRFRQDMSIDLIFFNDTAIAGTTTWPNHDNHFHVR